MFVFHFFRVCEISTSFHLSAAIAVYSKSNDDDDDVGIAEPHDGDAWSGFGDISGRYKIVRWGHLYHPSHPNINKMQSYDYDKTYNRIIC